MPQAKSSSSIDRRFDTAGRRRTIRQWHRCLDNVIFDHLGRRGQSSMELYRRVVDDYGRIDIRTFYYHLRRLRERKAIKFKLVDFTWYYKRGNMTTVVNINCADYDVLIMRPSKWGNPFTTIGTEMTLNDCIDSYENWLKEQPHLMAMLPELKGKRLGCKCKPRRCHGDVLARLANELP